MSKLNTVHEEHYHAEEAIKLIFRGLIPLAILGSGVALLALRLPGWSIILGLPMVVLGVVFLIYTYDEVVSKSVGFFPKKTVKCAKCGRVTPCLIGVDKGRTVCPSCQEKGI